MAGSFILSITSNGAFMFNLKASNGQVILTSQRYAAKASALGGIESVRANAVLDERYERRTAKDGSPYFVLKAANTREIGRSQDVLVARIDGERRRVGEGERPRRADRRRDARLANAG